MKINTSSFTLSVMDTLSSRVTSNHHGESSTYFLGWREYEKNAYDEVLNPHGIIQMGLAENQLSFDLAEAWLERNQEPCTFKRNGKSIFRELALFQDYHGLPLFKKVLAEFMGEIRGNKVKLDQEKIVLTAGATSANETLMFCLADPREAFLVPSPYYPGFDRDLKWRTRAEIIPIQCTSSNGFKITSKALQEAHEVAQDLHHKVKGVLITNPSNPLGITLTQEELDLILHYAVTNNVHVISDEIYSGTAHSSPPFISILEALKRYSKNSTLRERVHVVYSLSKDLGLPGFRVGLIYSNNKAILEAATKMSSFGLVSSQTQHLLSALLSDRAFVIRYIGENRRRIRKRERMLVSGLANAGIECLRGNAGLFCWVDMRKFLSSNTMEAEEILWKELIFYVGLNVSPGSSCHCCEPGWFRMCFANLSEEALRVAIQRIQAFVKSKSGPILSYCSAYSLP